MLPDHVVQSIMNSLGYLPPPKDADNGVEEDEALTVLRSKPPRLHLIHDEGIHQGHHCDNLAGPVPNVGRAYETLLEKRIGHLSPTPRQVKLSRVSLRYVQRHMQCLEVFAEQREFDSSDTVRHQGVHPVTDEKNGWGRSCPESHHPT